MIEKSMYDQSTKELTPFNFKAFGWKPLEPNTYLDEQLYLHSLIKFTERKSNMDFIFFNPDLCPDKVPIKEVKKQHGPSGKVQVILLLNNGFQLVFTNYFLWSNCLWLQDKLTNRLYPVYEYSSCDYSVETFRRLWNEPILQIPRPYIQPGDILVTEDLIDNKAVPTFSVIAYSKGESVWTYQLSQDSLKLSLKEQKLNPDNVFRTFLNI